MTEQDNLVTKFTLRPYQSDALNEVRAAFASGFKRVVLQLPCGGGKTQIAATMIRGAVDKGRKCLFVCDRIELIDQTSKRFDAEGIPHGVIQGQHERCRPYEPVQICSIQTLGARKRWPDAEFIIQDECHSRYATMDKIIARWGNVPMVGLSATPWSKGLGKSWEHLVVGTTTGELIDLGFLVPFRVYGPQGPDLSKVKTVAGEYHEGQLAEAVDQPKLVADIVSTWLKLGEDRQTICFATNILHSRHIVAQFKAAGVKAEHIDAYSDTEERRSILKRFEDGDTRIVSSVDILTKGYDQPLASCMIDARPTKSLILHAQKTGRVLRISPGKNCLARGTLVLTDCGEVEIQNITLDHKVWDGHNFVAHAGAVCNGRRAVMSYDGIIATPDHEVMTDDGWKRLEEAASGRLRITRSGVGGVPVRVSDDPLTNNAWKRIQPARGSGVRALFGAALHDVSQYEKEAWNDGVPALQWAAPGSCTSMALPSMPRTARQVYKQIKHSISFVRRARDRVSVFWSERCSAMGHGQPGIAGKQENATRPNRQQWPLRAWEYPLGNAGLEHEQHAGIRWARTIHSLSEGVSRSALCGQNTQKVAADDDARADCQAVGGTFPQTKREVWDILNAGLLQRFTANGRLVHNCSIILDHSGNTARLGFVTDEMPSELDDGKKKEAKPLERKEPLPKPCPSCNYMKPAKVYACPACGFKPEKLNSIESAPGELVEIIRAKKENRSMSSEEKARFYGELKWIAQNRGYNAHWADNTYRAKLSVWPNAYKDAPMHVATPSTIAYVQSRLIRHAKRRG